MSSSTSVSSSTAFPAQCALLVASACQSLETFELFLVCLGESIAEQVAERTLRVLRQVGKLVAIQIPVAQLRRHAEDRALLDLPVELVLQAIRIELRQHGFEREPHRRKERGLVIAHVTERILECGGGIEIRRIALHEQVVESVVDVRGKLQ